MTNKFYRISARAINRTTTDVVAQLGKSPPESLGRPRVIALAQVVVALAEHPQPRQVVRLHDLLLHGPLPDEGDRAPDGEAVVPEEHGLLQLLHADELRQTPATGTALASIDAGVRA